MTMSAVSDPNAPPVDPSAPPVDPNAPPRPPRPPRDPNAAPPFGAIRPSQPGGGQGSPWQRPAAPASSQPSSSFAPVSSGPTAPAPAPRPAPATTAPPVAPTTPGVSNTTPAAESQLLGSATNAVQGAVNAAPDRAALAQTTLQNLVSSTDPAYQQSLRQVGTDAAKYGRIGAGMTTTQLDDLALARQKSLDTTSSQLAADAAGQTQADRLAAAQTALQGYGTVAGQGTAAQNAATSATSVANQKEIAGGQLGLGQAQLGEQTREATAQQALQSLTADRNFLLNPDAAAAMAAKNGTDFSNLGPGTKYTPGADVTVPQFGKIDTTAAQGSAQGGLDALGQPSGGTGAVNSAIGSLTGANPGGAAVGSAISGLQGANPNQPAIDAALRSLGQLGGAVPAQTPGTVGPDVRPVSTGSTLDPRAIAADPAGFAQWQRGAAAAGYDPNTGQPLGSVGGPGGVTPVLKAPQSTDKWGNPIDAQGNPISVY